MSFRSSASRSKAARLASSGAEAGINPHLVHLHVERERGRVHRAGRGVQGVDRGHEAAQLVVASGDSQRQEAVGDLMGEQHALVFFAQGGEDLPVQVDRIVDPNGGLAGFDREEGGGVLILGRYPLEVGGQAEVQEMGLALDHSSQIPVRAAQGLHHFFEARVGSRELSGIFPVAYRGVHQVAQARVLVEVDDFAASTYAGAIGADGWHRSQSRNQTEQRKAGVRSHDSLLGD